jgi:hypothetical protein
MDMTPYQADEPITLSVTQAEAPTSRPESSVAIHKQYIAPLDGSVDPWDRYDTSMACAIMEVLVENYYGYDWCVIAESRQGFVAFSIPDLMGPTLKQFIRLAEHSHFNKKLIRDCGGMMLERMGLRRGSKDPAEYEAAKRRMHTFQFGDVKS